MTTLANCYTNIFFMSHPKVKTKIEAKQGEVTKARIANMGWIEIKIR